MRVIQYWTTGQRGLYMGRPSEVRYFNPPQHVWDYFVTPGWGGHSPMWSWPIANTYRQEAPHAVPKA